MRWPSKYVKDVVSTETVYGQHVVVVKRAPLLVLLDDQIFAPTLRNRLVFTFFGSGGLTRFGAESRAYKESVGR